MPRPALALALVAALTSLVGCTGPVVLLSENSAAEPPSTSPGVPEPIPTPWLSTGAAGLSTEVVESLQVVRELAPTRFPQNYAGVATGTPDSANVLVIYVADSTDDIEAGLRMIAQLPEAEIHFEAAYQSLEAANRVDREIMAGIPALREQGIELQTFGVGVDGVEDIGMDHPTDEQVAALFQAYGPYLRIDRTVAPAKLL